ncbi:hypothetical protein QWY82_09715 [Simiduia curdlanivorans]|uniref:Uncharacterized protein n=1 Tax=Simiduia curdlanivorans TaxID=1492769 RepID=A0ABV8V770_9GAMM|nr:hypothetical protein [Simiduia curdlanivorans]MDN3639084.1 hypothetical protein [Simiduia curdlanivorans]
MRRIAIWMLLFFPVVAHANAVWPALYLETRLFSWWAISVGLVVEYLFVRKLFQVTPKKAIFVTITANAASALLGILLIPLAGIAWEVFPGLLFYHVLNIGTFNPITWCATFIIACAVNVALEGLVYKKTFRLNFLFKSKMFLWFLLANAVSVGVAAVSLYIIPVQP